VFVKIRLNGPQPLDGISKVVFGGQLTDEEVESLHNRFEIYLFYVKLFLFEKTFFCCYLFMHFCIHLLLLSIFGSRLQQVLLILPLMVPFQISQVWFLLGSFFVYG